MSFNTSTKTALINLAKGALQLDPATRIPAKDPDFVAIIKEYREQTVLFNHAEPLLETYQIPQMVKQMTSHHDMLEKNRNTQAAHQSFTPRVLDLATRASERTEQHVRLMEDIRKLAKKTRQLLPDIAKQLWSKEGKKASSSLRQFTEVEALKKETQELQSKSTNIEKNLPELSSRLSLLSSEIKALAVTTAPLQTQFAPRQE